MHHSKYLIFILAVTISQMTGCQKLPVNHNAKTDTHTVTPQNNRNIVQPRTDESLVAYLPNGSVDHNTIYMIDPIELTGNGPTDLKTDLNDVYHIFRGPFAFTYNIFSWPLAMGFKQMPLSTQTSRSIYQATTEAQAELPVKVASKITTEDFANVQYNDLFPKFD